MFFARKPMRMLQPEVSLLWCARGATSDAEHEWVMPSGTAQLLVNVVNDRFSIVRDSQDHDSVAGAVLSGPFDRPLRVSSKDQEFVCGASFAPAGTSRFFDVPAEAFANCMVELAALEQVGAGGVSDEIDAIRAARDPEVCLRHLEEFLARLRRPVSAPPVVGWLAAELAVPDARLNLLAEQVGYSRRRLHTLVKTHVGFGPKRLQRVLRFREALVALGEPADITEIAHAVGYSDHSHLVHEFQDLGGMSPSDYRRLRTGYTGHVRS